MFDRPLSPLEIRETFAAGTIASSIAARADAESLGGYVASAFDANVALKQRALEAARRSRDRAGW